MWYVYTICVQFSLVLLVNMKSLKAVNYLILCKFVAFILHQFYRLFHTENTVVSSNLDNVRKQANEKKSQFSYQQQTEKVPKKTQSTQKITASVRRLITLSNVDATTR